MPFDLKLPTEIREGIKEICGGYPVLLQNACYVIYNIWRSGKTLTVETFVENFSKATAHIFQIWWVSFSPIEQTLLMLIVLFRLDGRLNKNRRYDLSDLGRIFTQNERALQNLEYRGFIKRIESSLSNTIDYQFTSSMMEWWVLREIESDTEEKISSREKIFLSLMSRKQMDNIRTAIRWLGSNIPF
jgi:hypothetical protein